METENASECSYCGDEIADHEETTYRDGQWFCCLRHYRYWLLSRDDGRPYRQDWDESQ